MIRSMTGFGTAEGAVGGAPVTIEVRSVNHRFFSPSIKLPSELARAVINAALLEESARLSGRRGCERGVSAAPFPGRALPSDLRTRYDRGGSACALASSSAVGPLVARSICRMAPMW